MTPVNDIHEALGAGKLLIVFGAGASKALTAKSGAAHNWSELIETGLEYGALRGKLDAGQLSQWKQILSSSDIDDLLGAAEFMSRKLEAPAGQLFVRWMQETIEPLRPDAGPMKSVVQVLAKARVPICTLNYDTLVEQSTNLPAIDFSESARVLRWMRGEEQGVLHLHGVWSKPETCILGIRDYEFAVNSELRGMIQRSLSSYNRLLFIGCGETLADPNFSALIRWMKLHVGAGGLKHYALVRNGEIEERLMDPVWQGFVEPLDYGSDYSDLPEFLKKNIAVNLNFAPRKTRRKFNLSDVDTTIAAYRKFIVNDCGQMTIEGMRADMETAQRKFDLERLFVPLQVAAVPPDIPDSDPEREQKLLKWREANPAPVSFGKAFKEAKRLALLALPGGGKTLLLKRLAVAYAEPARRRASDDGLPDIDLLPVLIRCREWKEHIRKPIPSLLQHIAQVTGEDEVDRLGGALENPLKRGNVLLLVDGLDEIHDDADRAIFVENLEKFLSRYPKTRLVVTSREAGFDLVAPCLVRFCVRWRIAPLAEEAIKTLCTHWHRLMNGTSPEAEAEAEDVAKVLLDNDSLRRLAENPLLLTMLLVVKHGAGRLPPDRVSLYERAVEVLLDTWNIKGHDALNVREAVPQLSCLAYQLLKEGKQTATERELLNILTEAREKLSDINRYAKDSPHNFLKRVELRSSLLVEAGHTTEGGRTVPFYQFRHLTFQEYLAAVAATHGHYLSYTRNDTVLTPLEGCLLSDEWKEVVPMAAVLARKQAAPLLRGLVDEARSLRFSSEGSEQVIFDLDRKIPASVSRLIQALVEEAEFPPELLLDVFQLISFFAKGCQANENWSALAQGPFGEDIIHQAWVLYKDMAWPPRARVRNTVALLEAHSRHPDFWQSATTLQDVLLRLQTNDNETVGRALLLICGGDWLKRKNSPFATPEVYQAIEQHLFDERIEIWAAAAWAWGFSRHILKEEASLPPPSQEIISRLVELLFITIDMGKDTFVGFLINELSEVQRSSVDINLDKSQADWVHNRLMNPPQEDDDFITTSLNSTAVVLAYFAKNIITDGELSELLRPGGSAHFGGHHLDPIKEKLELHSRPKSRRKRRRKT